MNTDKTYAEAIASEYAPKKESKARALKRLDAKAKRPATVFGYAFGTAMTLVLGLGLCLAVGAIGGGSTLSFVFGVIIGVVGLAGVVVNYPIYKRVLDSSKKKYAADIQALAKEIIDGSEDK